MKENKVLIILVTPIKFKGTRATVAEAQIARGKYDPNLLYSEQVAQYDIPFIAGPSGTATKILTP